ncbi:MAG: hypothetical protein MK316_06485 [Pseudomonadales bacterium]|nr:hypothetical protein [Pseudomonadales bacterium]
MTKIVLGIFAAALCTIVAAKIAYDASGHPSSATVNEPWAQHKLEFVTWNGSNWTAWIRDEAFEHRPQKEGKWHSHAKRTLSYINWQGTPTKATIDGEAFMVTPHGVDSSRQDAIRYRDWDGENRLRTFNQLQR